MGCLLKETCHLGNFPFKKLLTLSRLQCENSCTLCLDFLLCKKSIKVLHNLCKLSSRLYTAESVRWLNIVFGSITLDSAVPSTLTLYRWHSIDQK